MANKEKRFETIYTQGTSLSIVVEKGNFEFAQNIYF